MTCKIKECVSYTYQTKSLNLHKMQVGTLFYRFVSEAICIHRDRNSISSVRQSLTKEMEDEQ